MSDKEWIDGSGEWGRSKSQDKRLYAQGKPYVRIIQERDALAERVQELEKAAAEAVALYDGDPQLELREFKARALLVKALRSEK